MDLGGYSSGHQTLDIAGGGAIAIKTGNWVKLLIFKDNVEWLDVKVNDLLVVDVINALNDLSDKQLAFVFSQMIFFG